MKLAKPTSASNDLRYKIEQDTYLAHCQNIASILVASAGQKVIPRQALIDQYLEAVNTSTET